MKLTLIFISLCFFSTFVHASESDNYRFVICNSCNYEYEFSASASQAGLPGQVVVLNLEDRQARAFNIMIIPMFVFGDDLASALPSEVPSDIYDALNLYHQIIEYYTQSPDIHALKSLDSWSHSNSADPGLFGPICGPSGNPELATKIPDGVFAPACQAHDTCYAEGHLKGVCDGAFLDNMLYLSEQSANQYYSLITRILVERALKRVAKIYSDFVTQHQAALDAYCAIEINSHDPTCTNEPWSPDHGYNFTSRDSARGTIDRFRGPALVYECFFYSVTYSNGYTSRLEQCDFINW